jgi:GNAT superfamily N-acetyltransferase
MDDLPDKNVFMMCRSLDRTALSAIPAPYQARTCRPDELALWKAMPFDDAETAARHDDFMGQYFSTIYGGKEQLFFARTWFLCDPDDRPVATCLLWMAYGQLNTVHWFKVLKRHEGKGLGRALLSLLMRDLGAEDFPIYLHTQPESFRAIKLYSDFGFDLITNERFGRRNDLEECLPLLREHMPAAAFASLRMTRAPEEVARFLETRTTIEF